MVVAPSLLAPSATSAPRASAGDTEPSTTPLLQAAGHPRQTPSCSGPRVVWDSLGLCMQGSLPPPQLKMWNKRHASGQPCQPLHGESPYPFRHGVDIFLGRTGAALCPVAAHSSSSRTAQGETVWSALSHAGVNTAHFSTQF